MTGVLAFLVGISVALALVVVIHPSHVSESAGPTWSAYAIEVNELLGPDNRIGDTNIHCVTIVADFGDTRIALAGPCVTTYP